MFLKLLSYFIPIKTAKIKSDFNKTLEITWANGQLVLDSENANYSYGSLQRILKIGLKNIGFKKIKSMQQILVLGVAGGSVIKTLMEEINFEGKIIGVEIDSKIIEVANAYFKLDSFTNFEINIANAFDFMNKNYNFFDLIIVDIFEDTTMPNFLFETIFIENLKKALPLFGYLLFNTICTNETQKLRNKLFLNQFDDNLFLKKTIPKVELYNELILIQKKK